MPPMAGPARAGATHLHRLRCDNYTTTAEFLPQLQRNSPTRALREDAEAHGWDSEVARHSPVIASLQRHLDRATDKPPKAQPLDPAARPVNQAPLPQLQQLPAPRPPALRS